jgi:hypothetical protein
MYGVDTGNHTGGVTLRLYARSQLWCKATGYVLLKKGSTAGVACIAWYRGNVSLSWRIRGLWMS